MHRLVLVALLAGWLPASATPSPVLLFTEDFADHRGLGFAPDPAPGRIDSQHWRVVGASDGDGSFGGEHLAGDFARGSSPGGVTTGGVYAFEVGEGADGPLRVLGIQATASDFSPGGIELRLDAPYLALPAGLVAAGLELLYSLWVWNDGNRSTMLDLAMLTGGAAPLVVPGTELLTPGPRDDVPAWQRHDFRIDIDPALLLAGEALELHWRFTDAGGSGARDELGLGGIRLLAHLAEPRAVSAPASLWLLLPGLAALGGLRVAGRRSRSRRAVTDR